MWRSPFIKNYLSVVLERRRKNGIDEFFRKISFGVGFLFSIFVIVTLLLRFFTYNIEIKINK